MNNFKVIIYSDFNTQLFSKILSAKHGIFSEQANGIVGLIPPLLQQSTGESICLVWVTVEGFIKSYKLYDYAHDDEAPLIVEKHIDSFISSIQSLAQQSSHLFLCSFTEGRKARHPGIQDYSACSKMFISSSLNSSIAKLAFKQTNIHILDTEAWKHGSKQAIDEKSWYLTKCGFTTELLRLASASFSSRLDLVKREKFFKLILLDLDNTIWGGEVGENGWQGIRIGGHDHVGEAFLEFQEQLLRLTKQGVMIAIVSKNNESIALEVFHKHPDMILRLENISAYRINFKPKHYNAIQVAKELNIGLDSAIFIDDNPAERLSMAAHLPEVFIAELPTDPCLYPLYLSSLNSFKSQHLTEEDRLRIYSYTDNKQRLTVKDSLKSEEEWIKSLNTRITIEPLSNLKISRYVQLLNKTNQYNLRSRRMSTEELKEWIAASGNYAYTFHLSDNYGNLGVIGLLSYSVDINQVFIQDFVISCRAAGRMVEESMLYYIRNIACESKHRLIVLHAIQTAKNGPIINYLESSPILIKSSPLYFTLDIKQQIQSPTGVKLLLNSCHDN